MFKQCILRTDSSLSGLGIFRARGGQFDSPLRLLHRSCTQRSIRSLPALQLKDDSYKSVSLNLGLVLTLRGTLVDALHIKVSAMKGMDGGRRENLYSAVTKPSLVLVARPSCLHPSQFACQIIIAKSCTHSIGSGRGGRTTSEMAD